MRTHIDSSVIKVSDIHFTPGKIRATFPVEKKVEGVHVFCAPLLRVQKLTNLANSVSTKELS